MMNLSDDTEELEDFIRLDFADLQASENLQLLDPGIIDLECDSEDESISIKEPETFHAQPDLHSQSVTASHSNSVDLKPMWCSIKVVDCYKFPWYFDKFKDIIEHNLAINKSVEDDDKVLDDSSTDALKKQVATMQRQANDCTKEVTELNKEIDVIAAKELSENKKPVPGTKNARNNVKNNKMDFDIRRAMEQRKNSVVDLKRNIGLVGMKILRLPNTTASKLPIEVSISKQLKKPMEANTEKGQENKQEKGPTSNSHVKALDKVLTNVTSTTPVFKNIVEKLKDCVSTQNITGNSTPESFMRSISALVETETNSNNTPLDRRCNFESEISLELSVNKIAEEIYRLVRPHQYAGNINQTSVPNSSNTMTTLTKVTEEKNIKKSKYQSESIKKHIAEGTRTTKMIDPIPMSPKKRNKVRIKSHLESKAFEIIDITDQMSPKSSSTKSEKTNNTAEANLHSNKTPENIKDHKGKEMSSKYEQSTYIAKPKIVLSTKKTNKLTETIIKIKEMQQKESSLNEPTKSQKQSSNMTPNSTLSKSISVNRFLPKQIDTGDVIIPHSKNVGPTEQQLNGNDESKNIKRSSPKISIAQLQYSNRNDFENTLSKYNHPQNTTNNEVSTDLNVLVKTPEKEAEKVPEKNYSKSAQIIAESSVTVNRDESNNTSKNKPSQYAEKIIVEVKLIDSSSNKKSKQHHGTNQCPAINPIETATIVSNRETITSCTKFDTVSNHTSNVSNSAVIINTTTQNNQSPVMKEPLTVYNSMQAHTLYKPPESSYQTFRQSEYNAVRFPSHIPQVNQPIYNYTGYPLQNSTHHPGEILPRIDSRPPSSGVNEKTLPLMTHRLPMPPLHPTTFGAPMLNGIRPNMPTSMTHPGPNGGFGAQMLPNPRPMSPFAVSSQTSRPVGTISSQMPMNYPQISIDEMQSNDVLWSGPFSHMPPPPPPPPAPYQPASSPSQDISTSSTKSVPQSMDSSIIGRNIDGIVKKINITAPVIEQKKEIDSKAAKIKRENLERDTSTPLYDEISTNCFENIEPVNTKNKVLKILDTGLHSRFEVLTPADGIQNQAIQHSTINGTPNSKKENLLSPGKLGKSPNEATHEKCISGTRKINSPVENFVKLDRTPSKEHQKSDQSLPQKKENQHKSNHYLMNFIRKPKEKKDKKKEIPPKKCNESARNRDENVAEHASGNIKISAKQSSCIPEQKKLNEKTKKPISNHLKYVQDSKKGNDSKKLSGKGSKIAFEDLFGDGIDDAGCEKVASDRKSTGPRHSGLVNTVKTHEKSNESSVNMKRPANDEKPALSPKYRPGPLSKKKKLNDQERVNPHQINKKQILQRKTYSDPILPIPTYEKILSNMPSYLCFRDDIKNSSVTADSRYKKTSDSVNPKIPDHGNKIKKKKIDKEKERQKLEKAERLKKISLYEYKRRSTSERKVDHEAKDNFYKKHVEMHRRPSHADSDLGYDSDSTVKL